MKNDLVRFFYLVLALAAILFSEVEPFLQFWYRIMTETFLKLFWNGATSMRRNIIQDVFLF